MNFLKQRSLLFLTLFFLSWLSPPVLAQQLWQGTGQIIRGIDQGGLVDLKLEIEARKVKFLSGPSQNQERLLSSETKPQKELNGSLQTQEGFWRFQQFGQELQVTFYQEQPYRVIVYILHPL